MLLPILAILSSIAALVLHGILTWEHFLSRFGSASQTPLCRIGSIFNCAVVAVSDYSQFILQIPNSILGFWTNLAFLVFLSWAIIESRFFKREVPLAISMSQLLSYLILGASIVMGMISAFLLKHFCLFCVLAYLASLVQFFSTFFLFRGKNSVWNPNTLKTSSITIVTILGISYLTKEIIYDQLGGERLTYFIEESLVHWRSEEKKVFDYQLGITYHPAQTSSSRTLIEFVDPFCPHCKFASENLKSFIETRQGTLRLIVKTFPLDGNCNPHIDHKTEDRRRCDWSAWLLCMDQNQWGPLAVDWLFQNQAQLVRMSFKEGVTKFIEQYPNGPDLEQLLLCVGSQETQKKIAQMSAEGHQAKIRGTPAIFLDDKLLSGGHLPMVLERALRELRE
ncbi:MAG: thioredoxin domain-containing protein [Bdellovibrionaceae bacterium]|nr:thioredoxin domain-containing protein [Pseudobdellovibrionaceae bacterium]MDW8190317.1 vitamin K epoxide reductase family protein [Pseudobdellovibrionaceae bacterium]